PPGGRPDRRPAQGGAPPAAVGPDRVPRLPDPARAAAAALRRPRRPGPPGAAAGQPARPSGRTPPGPAEAPLRRPGGDGRLAPGGPLRLPGRGRRPLARRMTVVLSWYQDGRETQQDPETHAGPP